MCFLIECGCIFCSYVKMNYFFKRGIFCQFQCYCVDYVVISVNGILVFYWWWYYLNIVFIINIQCFLWIQGNDNLFGFVVINDFLCGFVDIVWLGEFVIYQCIEFFLVRFN